MRSERILRLEPPLAAALAEIHAAAFAEEGARGWSAAELLELCARPSARLWVASEAEGAPCAFLLCDLVLDEAEILTLATAPAARRRGAARGILRLGCDDLREESAQLLRLEVAADNISALGLYQSLGFQEIALRKAYFQRPDGRMDAKIFLLNLHLFA
ncbi:GNAT family N-acetyltransferase [Neomegalonema perideroedes]|uniref:GNAT family N-acetyltransferase n=1 Tax=Neomegalonema perideroedes TaxID=217219 RepID=UPI0003736123|nr:GNAT family N-acetyltransferase [Neomegalonema perideroedes]